MKNQRRRFFRGVPESAADRSTGLGDSRNDWSLPDLRLIAPAWLPGQRNMPIRQTRRKKEKARE
jgi:hypothetical protein